MAGCRPHTLLFRPHAPDLASLVWGLAGLLDYLDCPAATALAVTAGDPGWAR